MLLHDKGKAHGEFFIDNNMVGSLAHLPTLDVKPIVCATKINILFNISKEYVIIIL